jgi:low affinity Fe/Cu permease
MKEWFRLFAHRVSDLVGSPAAFITGLFAIAVWAATGSAFDYSDTWQLVINTGTTIVTFLMVFLIQNTQNRDARAVHLKLDELIRSVTEARNEMVGLENLSDEELEKLQVEFAAVHERAERRLRSIQEHRSRRGASPPPQRKKEDQPGKSG